MVGETWRGSGSMAWQGVWRDKGRGVADGEAKADRSSVPSKQVSVSMASQNEMGKVLSFSIIYIGLHKVSDISSTVEKFLNETI